MTQKNIAVFNWSGGKDSALCLYKVQQEQNLEVDFLLTTVNKKFERISMHGVREDLLYLQAKSLNLPVTKIELPEMPSMGVYEEAMEKAMEAAKAKGVTHSIFGDIFLEDLRVYRENKLSKAGLNAVFPLWKINTKDLVNEFIDLGFKSVLVCVNEKYLDKSFAGRLIDREFLKDLPPNVDPCGENGEYHSFVFDGPNFSFPIEFEIGETVYRKYTPPATDSSDSSYNCNTDSNSDPFNTGFWYTDLIAKSKVKS